MAKVVFVASRDYANQSALNTQLAALGITSLIVTGLNQPSQWAAQWAQSNGVPWVARSSFFDGAGYDPAARSVAAITHNNPDAILTAGTNAHTAAAAAHATAKGKSLTQL